MPPERLEGASQFELLYAPRLNNKENFLGQTVALPGTTICLKSLVREMILWAAGHREFLDQLLVLSGFPLSKSPGHPPVSRLEIEVSDPAGASPVLLGEHGPLTHLETKGRPGEDLPLARGTKQFLQGWKARESPLV